MAKGKRGFAFVLWTVVFLAAAQAVREKTDSGFIPVQFVPPPPATQPYLNYDLWGRALFPQHPQVMNLPSPSPPPATVSSFAAVSMSLDELKIWCDVNLKQVELLRNNLVNPLLPLPTSKQEVLNVVNKLDVVLGNTVSLAALLAEVHPDAQVRNESTICQLKVTSAVSKIGLDRKLYEVVLGVANEPALSAIDDRRFEKLLRAFHRSGVTLQSDAQRTQVQNLNEEIDKLASQFSQNINADTKFVARPITDTAALSGIPFDFIASHTVNGMFVVSTDAPDMQAMLKTATNATLRKDLFVAYHNRAVPKNLEILSQILAKRYQLAQSLNFTSYAHFAMQERMAKTPEVADAFTRAVANATKSRSIEEVNELLILKQQSETQNADKLYGYDSALYMDRLTRTRFGVGADEIRPYFRYTNTRDGVIAISSRMYGIRFQKVDTIAWHKDVEVYDMLWNHPPGGLVGRVYLDMHPRPNKFKHAAQFPITNGVRGIQLPSGALVCNFGPDELDHQSVTTFFHEFGHLLHHMLGGFDAKYAEMSGVATEGDFVEAPSQMFEEWAYDVETLQTFAVHNQTRVPIPVELVQRLNNSRIFGRSMLAQQQMFYAQLSLQLHLLSPSSFDISVLHDQIQREFSPYEPVADTHMLAGFDHLMDYTSNYYTYVWSESLSRHMLQTFTAAGSLLDPHVCLKYRDYVLSAGGQRPADVLVMDFTMRPFSLDAFHTYLAQRPATHLQ